MAPRRTRRTLNPTKADGSADQPLVVVINEAIKNGALKELVCELHMPFQMSALRKDGQYRTVPVTPNTELILSGVRAGAKGIIFEMKPVDPTQDDFDQFELDERKFFTAFPEIEPAVIRVLDFEAVDADDNPNTFEKVRGPFLKRAEEALLKREREIAAERQRKREAAERAEEERKKAERRKEVEHYLSNPDWGTWA